MSAGAFLVFGTGKGTSYKVQLVQDLGAVLALSSFSSWAGCMAASGNATWAATERRPPKI